MGLLWLACAIVILFMLLEHGCRDHAAKRQLDWFQLIAAQQLTVSKKARTRGDVDHHGRTRRQQART